jgi:hypothetical protein
MKRFVQFVAAIMFPACTGAAHAQCAGFTDVTPGTLSCQSVEWVKNRGITTGCTSATLYCPNNDVTRLQMALFMHRLAKPLTPEVLNRQAVLGAEVIPGPAPTPPLVRCVTTETAAAIYPRQAVVTASLTGLADGNAAGFNAFLLVSTDSGMTFNSFDAMLSVGQRATAAPSSWAGAAMTEHLNLAVNTPYQFAVGVRRDAVGPVTTGNFAAVRCQLTASIFNRNGTSSPFDEQ